MNTKNTASRARLGTRRYFNKHKVTTRMMAVSLAFLMAFSAFGANIASIVKLLETNAAAGDEYYTADLTLYDYFSDTRNAGTGIDSGASQEFNNFQAALWDSGSTTGYIRKSGCADWDDTTQQYLFAAANDSSDHHYYPLYLGLQYKSSGSVYKYPYIHNDGTNIPIGTGDGQLGEHNGGGSGDRHGALSRRYFGYSLAVNSEGGSSSPAAAQGLVDDTLHGNNVTQGNNAMIVPYFNSSFLTSKGVGATYSGKKFQFRKHTSNESATYEKDYTGYYVFDSKYDGLKVTDENGNTKAFTDYNSTYNYQVGKNTEAGYTAYKDEKNVNAFFPLGEKNFGFGARFDIQFTMTTNGKTPDGKDMTFNFRGDDDVWVFIDNKLILDIGGAHGAVEGNINFGQATRYVEYTKNQSCFTHANYDTIVDSSITAGTNEDILDKLNSINIYGDPTQKHTLTLFYIERGRIESNCLITFNFELADKLTVSNTVNADNVNATLKAETLQVAKHEGVEYLIANKGGKTTTESPDDNAPSTNDPLIEGAVVSDKRTITYYNGATQLGSGSYTTGSKIRLWNSSNLPSGTTGGANTELKGWNTAADGSGTNYECSDLITLNSNVTLYAQWAQKRTITFYSDGNHVGTVTGAEGAQVSAPSVSKTGYKLLGWSTTNGASAPDTGYEAGSTITVPNQDITLYAVWQQQPWIDFKESNGSSTLKTIYDDVNEYVGVPTVSKDGYRLLGWSDTINPTTSQVDYPVGGSIQMPSTAGTSKTVYAVWKETINLYNMKKPTVVVAIKENASGTTFGGSFSLGTWIDNYTPGSTTYDRFYANATNTVNLRTDTDDPYKAWFNVNNGSQYPRNTGGTDYSGDVGSGMLNLKPNANGGYLYLIDFETYNTYRYEVTTSNTLTGSGTNASASTNYISWVPDNLENWYIAYTALYRQIQIRKAQLESWTGTEDAYDTAAAEWKTAKNVYESNTYAYPFNGGGDTTSNAISKFNEQITALGGTSVTFGSMAPAALPNASSLNANRSSVQSAAPAGETDGSEDGSAETPAATEETTDGQTTDGETPDAQTTDGETTDGTEGENGEDGGLRVSAAAGTSGHWAGSPSAFGAVANTNYRLKNTGGNTSVIRQTPSTGKYNLLGGQESTFTMQFARGSQLKVAQTGDSYLYTTADTTNADTTSKPGTKKLGNAGADYSNLSTRYTTSWTLTDNNDPQATIDSSDSNITNMFTGYDNKTTTTNNNKSFEMDFLKGVDATNSQNVELTLAYTNTVIVQNIVVKKELGPIAAAKGSFTNTDFTFSVKYSNVFGATGTDGSTDYDAQQTYAGAYSGTNSGTATGGNITLKAGQNFVIENVPVYTKFYFTETYPSDGNAWAVTKVEVQEAAPNGAPSTYSYTAGSNSFSCTVRAFDTSGDAVPVNAANVGLGADTNYLVQYQAYTANADYNTYTVTNDIQNPYLVITKSINELYYGQYDDPAGLLGTGATVGGASSTTLDPNGYEAATRAEQTFLFKIEYYDTTSPGWKLLTYETISFPSNSTKSGDRYTASKVIKCQPNVQYRVSELSEWSWKYDHASTTVPVGTGSVSSKIATVTGFDAASSYGDYSNIAQVVFNNNKKTNDTEDIEGDTSVAHNRVNYAVTVNNPTFNYGS